MVIVFMKNCMTDKIVYSSSSSSSFPLFDFIPYDALILIMVMVHGHVKQLSSISKQWYRLYKEYPHWLDILYMMYIDIRNFYIMINERWDHPWFNALPVVHGHIESIRYIINTMIEFPYKNMSLFISRLIRYKYNKIMYSKLNILSSFTYDKKYTSLLQCIHEYLATGITRNTYKYVNFHSRDVFIYYDKDNRKYFLLQQYDKGNRNMHDELIKS